MNKFPSMLVEFFDKGCLNCTLVNQKLKLKVSELVLAPGMEEPT